MIRYNGHTMIGDMQERPTDRHGAQRTTPMTLTMMW